MDLSALGISPVLLLLTVGTVAGVVEGVKRAFDADWRAFTIILASGIIGGLLGLLLPFSEELWMSVIIGVVVGFSATGYITIAQDFGKNQI